MAIASEVRALETQRTIGVTVARLAAGHLGSVLCGTADLSMGWVVFRLADKVYFRCLWDEAKSKVALLTSLQVQGVS